MLSNLGGIKMKKKISLLLVSFIFIFSFCACSCNKEEVNQGTIYVPLVKAYTSKDSNGSYTLTYPFNTTISLTYFYESELNNAESYFKDEYVRLHQLFDRHYYYFDEEGNLINNLRVINESDGEAIVVDQDLINILKEGIRFTKLSKGKFNIGVGDLSSMWDSYISNANSAPSAEEIASNLACTPSYQEIENIIMIDEANSTVTINKMSGCDNGITITLGALAKSYAAEKIGNDDRLNSGNFLVNAGQSTIKIIGKNVSRASGEWNVGITDSYLAYSNNNKYASYLMVVSKPLSISTSSGDENHYFYNNNYYHHIIDPITGYPNQNRFAVTAVTSNAMYADIITTSLMSMDINESKEFLLTLKEEGITVEVFIQDKDSDNDSVKVLATSTLKSWISIRENESLKSYLDSIVIEVFDYDSKEE
jgi:thiamine biosynthesis lipoprotein